MTGDLHHLAAAYALDALADVERAEFEAHYPTCEICRAEVAQYRETAGHLADGAAATPPPRLERAVMDAIAHTPQEEVGPVTAPAGASVSTLAARRRRVAPRAALASAAAVAVLVVGAVVLVAQRGGPSPVEDLLAAPDAVVTTLALTPDGDSGSFRVVWSPARDQVAVLAEDLPDPGADRVYELWAIVGDSRVPAGLFEPEDGSVREAVDIDDVDAAAWGVTVEPAGGSAAPTTPILFFAEA
jgi:anti-sigma-K factor RskA